jgi:hypothetical protein
VGKARDCASTLRRHMFTDSIALVCRWLADVRWEGEEGDNPLPVAHPRLTNHGVLAIPALCKLHQGLLGLISSSGPVDGLEVTGDCFSIL